MRRKKRKRRVYFPKTEVFYRAINVFQEMFLDDGFTVTNPDVFKTVVADMRRSYRLYGFIGAAATLFYDLIMDQPLIDGIND